LNFIDGVMKILVLGGTYFIGRKLTKKLLEDEFDVTLLNRGTRGNVFPGIETLIADRHDAEKMKTVLRGKEYDAVVDVSGYTRDDTAMAFDSLRGRIGQYIYLSSAAVYAPVSGRRPFSEDDAKRRTPLGNEYGYKKWQAEEFLWQEDGKDGCRTTAIRPTYVYGPHDYSRRFRYIFEQAENRRPILVRGDGENMIQPGYVDDLAEAIVKMAGNPAAYGEAFNISGAETVSVRQLVREAAGVLGAEANIAYLNEDEKTDSEFLAFPAFDYFVDSGKAKDFLGIIPKMGLAEGLEKTAEWWRKI